MDSIIIRQTLNKNRILLNTCLGCSCWIWLEIQQLLCVCLKISCCSDHLLNEFCFHQANIGHQQSYSKSVESKSCRIQQLCVCLPTQYFFKLLQCQTSEHWASVVGRQISPSICWNVFWLNLEIQQLLCVCLMPWFFLGQLPSKLSWH